MEINALNGNALAADSALDAARGDRLRTLAGGLDGEAGTREGLRKAAKEFEAVFLDQLMKSMRATVPDNELFNSGGPTKYYQQMYDTEMAKALADGGGGMGIARLIVEQFSRDGDEVPAAGDPAPRRGGPVLPEPVPQAVRGYERQAVSGPEGGRMLRLQRLADRHSEAAADTLRRFEGPLVAASRETGLDPGLLLSVVLQESGGNPDAVSPRGAEGLMQLMPATAGELGVTDASDPLQNVVGGARYLKDMLDRYDGNLDLALAAYNAGPGNVAKAGGRIPDFAETRDYVAKVKDRYRDLGGGTELADPAR